MIPINISIVRIFPSTYPDFLSWCRHWYENRIKSLNCRWIFHTLNIQLSASVVNPAYDRLNRIGIITLTGNCRMSTMSEWIRRTRNVAWAGWLRDDPANTKHLYNISTTSVQRLRRWSNIVQMVYKCSVFTMMCSPFQEFHVFFVAHQTRPHADALEALSVYRP